MSRATNKWSSKLRGKKVSKSANSVVPITKGKTNVKVDAVTGKVETSKGNQTALVTYRKPIVSPLESTEVLINSYKELGVPFDLWMLLTFANNNTKEDTIINIIAASIKQSTDRKLRVDGNGNASFEILDNGKLSTVMFTAHMDTVSSVNDYTRIHLTTGPDAKDSGFLIAKYNNDLSNRTILGADDKVGCYILLEMIKAKIPGLYYFFHGEEVGCVGSRALVDKNPAIFKNINMAIAMDRKGYGDVINRQGGSVCCSDEFSKALATQLNEQYLNHLDTEPKGLYRWSPCTGVFTDTAVMTKVVPECTNLSVGYFAQHSAQEKTDLIWLKKILLPSVLNIEWSKLPVVRDPLKVITPTYQGRQQGDYSWQTDEYGAYYNAYHDGDKEDMHINLPNSLVHVEDWEPIQGHPYSRWSKKKVTDYEFKQRIRKWLYKNEEDSIEDLMSAVSYTSSTEEDLSLKEEEIGVCKDVLTDAQMVIYCTAIEAVRDNNYKYITPEMLKFMHETDVDNMSGFFNIDWKNNKWHFFDHSNLSFIDQDDKKLSVYGKKGKKIARKHLHKCVTGTRLFVLSNVLDTYGDTYEQELKWVHTINKGK